MQDNLSAERQIAADRRPHLKRAVLLSLLTVTWNILEGIIATVAGALAGSVALVGFGVDSFIETASGVVVGRRFLLELNGRSAESAELLERRAAKIAGGLLLCLAAYLVVDAVRRLAGLGREPEVSLVGIILTFISLVVMPLLGWSKIRTARALSSRALRADAYETITCAWLSLTTLVGLVLNWALGWTWADPIAACVLVPLIVREGLESWRGESCHDDCHD
jgi:divalent metal cation (Fe/Co/Zn/Cd) transporter